MAGADYPREMAIWRGRTGPDAAASPPGSPAPRPMPRFLLPTFPALFLVVLACLCTLFAAQRYSQADDSWWDTDWRYRRRLRPNIRQSPRPDVAWAQVPVPEGCHPRGHDFRILTAGGQGAPSRVMFHDPALYAVVAFQIQDNTPHYYLYMGNPKARPARGNWEPQAGVFMETWRRNGGHANNWEGMRHVLDRANYQFGAGYRKNIYDGFNPFGEPDNFVSRYTAWFRAPRPGTYLFATISDDASFLQVDGKMVAQWPGYHTAHGGRRGEHRGKIDLTAGLHKLEYYHLEFSHTQTMIAAWRPPGDKDLSIMPEGAFVPVAPCYVDELQDNRSDIVADLRTEQVEWLELDDYTYIVQKFFDLSYSPGAKIVSRKWTFSDGTTYNGEPLEKLFLHKGQAKVTLQATDSKGRKASTTRPLLLHPIDKMERADIYDLTFLFLKAIKDTPVDQLRANDILAAAHLLRDQRHLAQAVELYTNFLDQHWKSEQRIDTDILQAIVDVAESGYGHYREIEQRIQGYLARMPREAPERALVYLILGRLQLDRLEQPETALSSLQTARLALGRHPDDQLERRILIAIGDAHRQMAKPDEAREAYLSAQAIDLPRKSRHDYDVSSYALTAEAYIRRGHLDEAEQIIDEWNEKFPTERLVGYSAILEARVKARRGKPQDGAALIETFLACKPQGVFLQNALLELGDIYAQMGRARQARQTYQRLLEEFETQENRQEVEEKIQKLKDK